MRTLAVIPARFGSTRFPGKPLADKTGKPLIQHVVEQVRRAGSVDRVIVATDDRRIFEAVARFGGEAMMTRGDHPNGTCRIAEVVEKLGAEAPADAIVVNVQGDEPEIEPRVIDELVAGLRAKPEADMATLASDFADDEDPADPNIVKLVVDQRGYALYFSRSLIPFDRDGQGVRPLKHPGLYAYRCAFLPRYVTLAATPLEEAEKLEQLRALEHGFRIAVVRTVVRHHGIDTPRQYEAFVRRVGAMDGG
jgi:3-deoxy-manno-octulosonate cytidylyltransferase (CMP-KDO synthetase)